MPRRVSEPHRSAVAVGADGPAVAEEGRPVPASAEGPSHAEVLAVARAARSVAAAGDRDAVYAELDRLRDVLVRHLKAERAKFGWVCDPVGRLALDGQERLMRLLNELLSHTPDDDEACTCIVRTAEVEHLLRRQARLEATAPGIAEHGAGEPREEGWSSGDDDG